MTTLIPTVAYVPARPRPGRPDSAGPIRAIRAEYHDMPGLSLTRRQVQKLWGLSPDAADRLLAELITAGFLRCNDCGRYVRADISH